jgi:anti-anti-sigma factor
MGENTVSLDLDIEVNKEGSVTIIAVKGELDDFHAPKLNTLFAKEIENKACEVLVVDLEGVTFIDSVGLGTIAIAGKKIVQKQGKMNLVCSRPLIKKLITASGIVEAMKNNVELYESLDKAKSV